MVIHLDGQLYLPRVSLKTKTPHAYQAFAIIQVYRLTHTLQGYTQAFFSLIQNELWDASTKSHGP